mmetsp:Transcript_101633/g.242330  ORF Transcript_101633/g.242330 Transcript_101633/m.242330 type:complete len:343 (-) Transcript_101633:557-1585(-)
MVALFLAFSFWRSSVASDIAALSSVIWAEVAAISSVTLASDICSWSSSAETLSRASVCFARVRLLLASSFLQKAWCSISESAVASRLARSFSSKPLILLRSDLWGPARASIFWSRRPKSWLFKSRAPASRILKAESTWEGFLTERSDARDVETCRSPAMCFSAEPATDLPLMISVARLIASSSSVRKAWLFLNSSALSLHSVCKSCRYFLSAANVFWVSSKSDFAVAKSCSALLLKRVFSALASSEVASWFFKLVIMSSCELFLEVSIFSRSAFSSSNFFFSFLSILITPPDWKSYPFFSGSACRNAASTVFTSAGVEVSATLDMEAADSAASVDCAKAAFA